ncbi:KN motif and ankyrin repeat domain-containing protein 4 [Caerostris darwini]|uniref:KN motif and ankyrin repeat domain-containing protein 4 n=1 Tax=Caerostris darwini TaxID=1538125 RepID=A0AAV4SN06_9ARAC|nr:KN motif and ankyrin repeat domain-containing protein 4 [Caerostris darwini]
MTTFEDLLENKQLPDRRNYKNSVKHGKLSNQEDSVQITAFRMFLEPSDDTEYKNVARADLSGDFVQNVSEPKISRVILSTNGMKINSKGEQNVDDEVHAEERCVSQFYNDQFDDCDNTIETEILPKYNLLPQRLEIHTRDCQSSNSTSKHKGELINDKNKIQAPAGDQIRNHQEQNFVSKSSRQCRIQDVNQIHANACCSGKNNPVVESKKMKNSPKGIHLYNATTNYKESPSYRQETTQKLGKNLLEFVKKASKETLVDVPRTETAKPLNTVSDSRRSANEIISLMPNLHCQPTVNPIDIIFIPNVSKIRHEMYSKNTDKKKLATKCSGKRDMRQKNNEEGDTVSSLPKSVVFCRSSQISTTRGNEIAISLCDDCYFRTRKMIDEQADEDEVSSVSDVIAETVILCMEPIANSNSQSKCKEGALLDEGRIVNSKFEMDNLNLYCEAVNNHLLNLKVADEDFLKTAVSILNQKWFDVIADKNCRRKDVYSYLKYFHKFSDNLVKTLMFSTDKEGNNALHFACSNNRFDIVEELLNYDFGPELLTQKNKSRQTPLMNAASQDSVEMVRMLLEAGADPNLQDNDGSTALMYAAVHGHEPCIQLLLDHPKCNPRIKDYDQQTACTIALEAGHKDLALLIYLHAKKSTENKTQPMANHDQNINDLWDRSSTSNNHVILESQSDL